MYRHVWEKPTGRKTVGGPGLNKDDDGPRSAGAWSIKVERGTPIDVTSGRMTEILRNASKVVLMTWGYTRERRLNKLTILSNINRRVGYLLCQIFRRAGGVAPYAFNRD